MSELEIKTSLEVYRAIHKTESHWSESDVICDMNNRKNNEGNIPDGISNKKELIAEGIRFARENKVFLAKCWVSLDSLVARDAKLRELTDWLLDDCYPDEFYAHLKENAKGEYSLDKINFHESHKWARTDLAETDLYSIFETWIAKQEALLLVEEAKTIK